MHTGSFHTKLNEFYLIDAQRWTNELLLLDVRRLVGLDLTGLIMTHLVGCFGIFVNQLLTRKETLTLVIRNLWPTY